MAAPADPAALDRLRPVLARDGIFNVRDLGGLEVADGRRVVPGALVRGDALHRCGPASVAGLHAHGVRQVLDLRDDSERAHEGTFDGPGIDVLHLPVLDPAYRWEAIDGADGGPVVDISELLAVRYAEILDAFAPRFVAAVDAVANADGGVAYHCAVGKDRTGLLTALLLGVLGAPREVVVADYVRSAGAVAVQVQWLRAWRRPAGAVSEEEQTLGVWSARAESIEAALDHLDRAHGGAAAYLVAAGLDGEVPAALRARLLTGDGAPPAPVGT